MEKKFVLLIFQSYRFPAIITWTIFSNYFYCSAISHHMPVRLKGSSLAQNQRMQYAEWLGNTTSLIIINENDIYLRQSPADEKDIRLTHTGIPGLIYNGVTDFLYQGEKLTNFENWVSTRLKCDHFWIVDSLISENSKLNRIPFSIVLTEEIFKSQKAIWSSNDGSKLLYASFNDTNVGQMIYPWFSSNSLIQSGKSCRPATNYFSLLLFT